MKYEIKKDLIIIQDKKEFDITQILECGQVFSYKKISDDKYEVFSRNLFAVVTVFENRTEIRTKDVQYFINYFDLDTDYSSIKNELLKFAELVPAINSCGGIRILRQDYFETIISFVISANNNIPRIQKSLFYLRTNYGEKKEGYHAFPTFNEMRQLSEQDFINAGIGYRACQMKKLLQQLEGVDLNEWEKLDVITLKNKLVGLSGIGPKVADCILLYGYGKKDVFPVDTWMEKVFHDIFGDGETNRVHMREMFIKKYGDLSGVAQQYMFYYKRVLS